MAELIIDNAVGCAHCGDPCPEGHVIHDDKDFCCQGCAAVYSLLSESGLEAYYLLDEETPGISRRKTGRKARYEFLDEPEMREKLLSFTDGRKSTITLSLPQIHCSACIWLLEHMQRLAPGILRSEVSFSRREATVTFDENQTSLRKVVEVLDRIGYEPDLKIDSIEKRTVSRADRAFYIKLGLAGFAFGNIMLFSLPEYLAGAGGIDTQFIHLFGHLNLILALPVLLYSSTVFYRPALLSIRQRQWNMDIAISLGILAMFFRSTYEILTGYGVGYMDSFTMLVFFLLAGKLFQRKTFDRLSFDRDYRSYFPLSTLVQKGETEQAVPAIRLQVGDIVVLRHGELLPADARLLSGKARIDYSFVTGESDEIAVEKGQVVYAGGRIMGSRVELVVTSPVSQSYLTSLWNRSEFREERDDTLHSLSRRFSRFFAPTIVLIAIGSALYWLPQSPATAINAFTAVLIIACPCALALTTPFTLGWVTGILGRNRFYLKSAEVAEKIAVTDTIIFDKTGTLTFPQQARVRFSGMPLSDQTCNHLASGLRQSTHPVSRSILRYLDHPGNDMPDFFEEVPGRGIAFGIGGKQYRVGNAGFADGVSEEQIAGQSEKTRSYVSRDGDCLGFFEISGRYRPGLVQLMERLRRRFTLHLLSGDTAGEKEALKPLFGDESRMHFEKKPEQKLEYVRDLSRQRNVLMIGDGLNDAGALRASTTGIAVTDDTGTFTPSSDAILHSSILDKLDSFIDFTRYSRRVIKMSFGLSLMYNVIGLSFAVTGTLSPLVCAIIMPISSVTVILFTTAATHLGARNRGII